MQTTSSSNLKIPTKRYSLNKFSTVVSDIKTSLKFSLKDFTRKMLVQVETTKFCIQSSHTSPFLDLRSSQLRITENWFSVKSQPRCTTSCNSFSTLIIWETTLEPIGWSCMIMGIWMIRSSVESKKIYLTLVRSCAMLKRKLPAEFKLPIVNPDKARATLVRARVKPQLKLVESHQWVDLKMK